MNELLIDDSDPRILCEVIRSDEWKTLTRSMVRDNGVIWMRVSTFYNKQGWGTDGDWESIRKEEIDGKVVSYPTNDLHDYCVTLLDRHDLRLEHAALTGNRAVSEGWL